MMPAISLYASSMFAHLKTSYTTISFNRQLTKQASRHPKFLEDGNPEITIKTGATKIRRQSFKIHYNS